MEDLPHIDLEALLAKFDGEMELLLELAGVARQEFGAQLAQLNLAAKSRETEAVRSKAHAIKGGLGNFEALKAHDLARRVELAAKEGDLALALSGLELLNREMDELMAELDQLGGD